MTQDPTDAELLKLCNCVLENEIRSGYIASEIARALKSRLTSPDVTDERVKEIAERHAEDGIDEHAGNGWTDESYRAAFRDAHADRATLLSILQAAPRKDGPTLHVGNDECGPLIQSTSAPANQGERG